MDNVMTIEDFKKANLIIGEIKKVSKNKITINGGEKELETKFSLNVKKGDKIVIVINENELIIPLIDENNPLIPDNDLPAGSKVS